MVEKKEVPKQLTPFNKMDPEKLRILQSKGGSVRSENKVLAAKLRWLKRKGLNDETAKRIYEIMTDSVLSTLEILRFLEDMKKDAETIGEKNMIVKNGMELHKLIHGDKIEIEHKGVMVMQDMESFFVDKVKPKVIDIEIDNLDIEYTPREIVVSSNVVSIGYNKQNKVLEVEYNGGSIYKYNEVPIEVHEELMQRDVSKGKYIAQRIKDKYKCIKMEKEEEDEDD